MRPLTLRMFFPNGDAASTCQDVSVADLQDAKDKLRLQGGADIHTHPPSARIAEADWTDAELIQGDLILARIDYHGNVRETYASYPEPLSSNAAYWIPVEPESYQIQAEGEYQITITPRMDSGIAVISSEARPDAVRIRYQAEYFIKDNNLNIFTLNGLNTIQHSVRMLNAKRLIMMDTAFGKAIEDWVLTPQGRSMAARNETAILRAEWSKLEHEERVGMFQIQRLAAEKEYLENQAKSIEGMIHALPADASGLGTFRLRVGSLVDQEQDISVGPLRCAQVLNGLIIPNILADAFEVPPVVIVSPWLKGGNDWIEFSHEGEGDPKIVAAIQDFLISKLSDLPASDVQALWQHKAAMNKTVVTAPSV